MAYQLILFLTFGLICFSAAGALICGCSRDSGFCEEDGRCNATAAGEKLRTGLKVAKKMVDILTEYPKDQIRSDLRNELCQKLSSIHQKTDLFLLDFLDWEPACVRIGMGPRHTCSMAPRDMPKDQLLTKETLTKKLNEIHQFLGCQGPSGVISEDWHICRGGNLCNLEDTEAVSDSDDKIPDIFKVDDDVVNPLQLVVSTTEAYVAQGGVNVIVYIIIGVVAFLLVLLIVLAFVCYRFSVWKVVYRVSEKKQKQKDNEKVMHESV